MARVTDEQAEIDELVAAALAAVEGHTGAAMALLAAAAISYRDEAETAARGRSAGFVRRGPQ